MQTVSAGRQALIGKMFYKILPSQMMMIVITNLNSIIDSFFTGRFLGTTELSALGFYAPLTNLLCLCYVFITGTQVLSCREIGKGRKEEVSSLFSTCFVLLLGLGALLGLLMAGCGRGIGRLMGAEGEAAECFRLYLLGMSFGTPFMMFYSLFTTFLQLNDRNDLYNLSFCVLVISNALMDAVCLLVLDGGIFGLAIASSVSNILGASVGVFGFIKSKKRKLAVEFTKHLCFSRVWEIIQNGLVQLGFNLVIALRSFVINRVLARIGGTEAVAVMAVFNTLCAFTGLISVGCGNAELTIGSIFYGENNRIALSALVKRVLRFCVLSNLSLALVFFLLAKPYSHIYFAQNDPAFAMSVRMIRIFVVSLPFAGAVNVLKTVFQCEERNLLVNGLTIADQLLIVLMVLLLPLRFALNGIWLSFLVSEILMVLGILVCVCVGNRRRIKTFEDVLYLPKGFGVSEEDMLEQNITSMEDAVQVSKTVQEFCLSRGVPRRNAFFTALCAEEVAANILSHGMKKDNKKHHVNLCLVVQKGKVRLQILDDCKAFDPATYLEQFKNVDPARFIGLKIVSGIAERMTYQRYLGINSITVEE